MQRQKLACYGLASAMALTMALPAQAADIYRGEGGLKDPAPVEYVPSITWTGFYLGGHLGATWDDSDDVELVDDAVFTGGGHVGFNWQGPSNIVLGIEADLSYMDDIDYLATVRGRLGYAFGPTMAYITGGGAYIELGDFDDTGWVAGGGFEHKLRQNVSFGVEGLYHDFESDDDFGDPAFWTARARLTYHFGGARN